MARARRDGLLGVEPDVDPGRARVAQQLVDVERGATGAQLVGELDVDAVAGGDVQHERLRRLGAGLDGAASAVGTYASVRPMTAPGTSTALI